LVSGPSTGILVAKTKKKYCKFKTIRLRIIDRIQSFKRNRNNPERNEANNRPFKGLHKRVTHSHERKKNPV